MDTILVTGASGFFGSILKRRFLDEGFQCVNIDLLKDVDRHRRLQSIQGDIRDNFLVRRIFSEHRFAAVYHCAAFLAHGAVPKELLWSSNVDGTRNIVRACHDFGVPRLIFTSTNCLWAHNVGRPVREVDPPSPVETYGRSKLAAERVLGEYSDKLDVVILRCPTIIDRGRLGLLAILFEFIQEGRKIWVVGNGSNLYQFIYAQDLATACIQILNTKGSQIFHVGADDVKPLRTVYETVIAAAGSSSRVVSLPKAPTVAAMKLAYAFKVSPLGPYHYRMIAEDFVFNTNKIKQALGWKPTLSNEEMLVEAFRYYAERRSEIELRENLSAHRSLTPMGALRLLKWIS